MKRTVDRWGKNPDHILVQVSINDLVILVAFVPIVKFLLGVNQISVPYDTLIYSVVFFVVIPLAAGYLSRVWLLKRKGQEWFENVFNRKAISEDGYALMANYSVVAD